jgi:hypothetical protein
MRESRAARFSKRRIAAPANREGDGGRGGIEFS